jgi:hypothetical protein
MVAPTCFGIALPSSGSVPSAFWEMLNWGAVDRILWVGVLCLETWCVFTTNVVYIYIYIYIYDISRLMVNYSYLMYWFSFHRTALVLCLLCYTVELHLSGLSGTASNTETWKIRKTGFFFENRPHCQFEVENKLLKNGWFRLHIYLHTDKTLNREECDGRGM